MTKPCLAPGCKPYPKKPSNPVHCWWHWLIRQPPVVQAEAARARLANHQATGREFRSRVVPQLWPSGERWCAGCQSMVPLFYARGSRCRACDSEAKHAARVQETYGLAEGQYAAIVEAQGGRCAICGNKPLSQRLAVDHDHGTNEVRGALCQQCNHDILGGAHDRLDILERAVLYLKYPPARDAAKWRNELNSSGLTEVAPMSPFEQPGTYVSARSSRQRAGS